MNFSSYLRIIISELLFTLARSAVQIANKTVLIVVMIFLDFDAFYFSESRPSSAIIIVASMKLADFSYLLLLSAYLALKAASANLHLV